MRLLFSVSSQIRIKNGPRAFTPDPFFGNRIPFLTVTPIPWDLPDEILHLGKSCATRSRHHVVEEDHVVDPLGVHQLG